MQNGADTSKRRDASKGGQSEFDNRLTMEKDLVELRTIIFGPNGLVEQTRQLTIEVHTLRSFRTQIITAIVLLNTFAPIVWHFVLPGK